MLDLEHGDYIKHKVFSRRVLRFLGYVMRKPVIVPPEAQQRFALVMGRDAHCSHLNWHEWFSYERSEKVELDDLYNLKTTL
jgi:hypothetical protein